MSFSTSDLTRLGDTLWEIPVGARADMRVPARVFADAELLEAILGDRSLEQLQNVATLPGIVDAALAMPDIHQGYGFPVGGVAATELPDGVVSPGGVGYDINCGVRLLVLPLTVDEIGARVEPLVHELSRAIPAGMGKGGPLELDDAGLNGVLQDGSPALLRLGIGTDEDVERTESGGCLPGADPAAVSERARLRGRRQLGTLGSGNHFVELQVVARVDDPATAEAFGLALGRAHRADPLRLARARPPGLHGLRAADGRRPRGLRHPAARPAARMRARLVARGPGVSLGHGLRGQLRVLQPAGDRARGARGGRPRARPGRRPRDPAGVRRRPQRGQGRAVRRPRPLRAPQRARRGPSPPAPPTCPEVYRAVGQPVFVPGSMGTASYVLAGEPASLERSFGTTCHGAGRAMSRTGARKRISGADLRRQLEAQGIVVRCPSNRGLAEEAPFAYKDVERVVDVVARAGLARKVVQLRPLGVVKG